MAQSKEVKSFLWTQALRRDLSQFCGSVKLQIIKDAQALLHGLDFSEVSNVQRMMRKDKRSDTDLKRLRDLNQAVFNIVELKSTQQKNVLRIGKLTSDDLLILAADLEKLKSKIIRTEGPRSTGVYMGNLTTQQLDQRRKLLNLVGMAGTGGGPKPGNDGVVRIWDVKDSSLLNNQFGTMPSLTIACMSKQGQADLNDVVHALADLGLIYTAKYPNASDLEKLAQEHPALNIIDTKKSSLNISGYNFSLNAAVKAGACMLDGGNMLETIRVTPNNLEDILSTIIKAKRSMNMFISDTPGERNPYENILYKVCLSGNGWPYISCRTSLQGRAWDNTVVDLLSGSPGTTPINSPMKPKVSNNGTGSVSLSYSQIMCLRDLMESIDPNAKTWIDIEGRPEDPVEVAIFQPATGNYIHFYREPTDLRQFKQDSKYSHGMDIKDLFNVQPGLTSAVLEILPQNMVLTCQGSDDIRSLLDSQGRRDLKLIDVAMPKSEARKYENEVWDQHKSRCKMHTGIVFERKKKGKEEITPHCALFDCIMFEAAVSGGFKGEAIRPILPMDLVFRKVADKVVL
nr:nucleocapsid protein [Songea mammarenavirus]